MWFSYGEKEYGCDHFFHNDPGRSVFQFEARHGEFSLKQGDDLLGR
jgi:hypothetical protein